MANLIVNAIAEWNGSALTKGQKQIQGFTKSIKNLGRALGLGLSVAAVVAFGKASLKAFAADETSARRLSTAVTNLGLSFENTRITKFIADLEQSAHVADDVLRPAFQNLLTNTGSVTKSQELLALALDVSAGSGYDVAEVSKDLGLAYLGTTKGLAKYNTGLTKAELSSAQFLTVQQKLSEQYGGQNAARLETFQGKMDALSVSYSNLQESVGEGLVTAFSILAGDQGIGSATSAIENFGNTAQDVLIGTASYVDILLNKLSAIGATNFLAKVLDPLGLIGKGISALQKEGKRVQGTDKTYGGIYATKYLGEVEAANAVARKKAELEAIKRAKELAAQKGKTAALEAAALKAKKLQNAIDKANLTLNKGNDLFNLDQIQIAAALANQAEALGKATSSAQVLQIANDAARLRVKQDILNLEDAIAAKDEAAITRATAKLNEDLKVLNALSGQSNKLTDIKSILDSLKPKDLINIDNLNAALAKIQEMLNLLAQANATSKTSVPTSASLGSGIPANDYIAPISTAGGSIDAILEYADSAAARANAFADLLDMQNVADAAAFQSSPLYDNSGALQSFRQRESATNVYVTVQGSVLSEQDLTNVVQQAVQMNNRYGNNLNVAGSV